MSVMSCWFKGWVWFGLFIELLVVLETYTERKFMLALVVDKMFTSFKNKNKKTSKLLCSEVGFYPFAFHIGFNLLAVFPSDADVVSGAGAGLLVIDEFSPPSLRAAMRAFLAARLLI